MIGSHDSAFMEIPLQAQSRAALILSPTTPRSVHRRAVAERIPREYIEMRPVGGKKVSTSRVSVLWMCPSARKTKHGNSGTVPEGEGEGPLK
jgi:hypothetical protein